MLSPTHEVDDFRALLEVGANPELPHLPATAIGYLAQSSEERSTDSSIPILNVLVSGGCNVNDAKPAFIAKRPLYDYSIHIAIRAGAGKAFLQALIRHGADINADGGFGTPLFQARKMASFPAIRLLHEEGAREKAGKYGLAELSFLGRFVQSHLISLRSRENEDARANFPRVDRSGEGVDLDALEEDWVEG